MTYPRHPDAEHDAQADLFIDPAALLTAISDLQRQWRECVQPEASPLSQLQSRARRRALETRQDQLLRALGAQLWDRAQAGREALLALVDDLAPFVATSSEEAEPQSCPPAPAPEPLTLDAAKLKALKEAMKGNAQRHEEVSTLVYQSGQGQAASARPAGQRPPTLTEALALLGPVPKHLRGKGPVKRELAALERTIDTSLGAWAALAAEDNHALTALVTARARALQDAIESGRQGPRADAQLEAVGTIIRVLTRHSNETQPGFVHGLKRTAAPEHRTWLADAEAIAGLLEARWPLTAAKAPLEKASATDDNAEGRAQDAIRRLNEQLRASPTLDNLISGLHALLIEHPTLPWTDPRLKGLAENYQDLLGEGTYGDFGLGPLASNLDAHPAEDAETPWPHRHLTEGKVAVLVGGDHRPERVEAITRTFGFSDLEWLKTDQGPRQLESLGTRVRQGTVDIVILLQQFVSHSATDAMFALKDRCHVVLAETYGIGALKRGLERYLVSREEPQG